MTDTNVQKARGRGRLVAGARILTLICVLAWPAARPFADQIAFVDGSESSGITFVHVTGASGKKYVMECVSSGCGLLDFDDDGDLDVYMVNGAPLPGFRPSTTPRNRLYRNEGREKGWTFTDVTESAGVGDAAYGMGCAVGDYDNDGDVDLYVTNYGANVLYQNQGDGTFTDVTAKAGVGVKDDRWSSSAAFLDFDRDGHLDIYVVNYVDYHLDNNWRCTFPGTDIQTYCHPDFYPPVADVLYRNNGDGTFTDFTKEAGVYSQEGKGLGLVCGDFDQDGAPDIYVANDSVAHFLFLNRGDGRFEEAGLYSGSSFNGAGDAEAGMGVACADIEGDGDADILLGHLDMETNTLYRNEGDGSFTDVTRSYGVGMPSLNKVAFGLVFLDADNDGDPDAFVANGHVIDNIHLASDFIEYRQQNQLIENVDGVFKESTDSAGPALETRKASRGLAAGDIDNDGDIDLIVNNMGERFDLLLNESNNGNSWLSIELVGAARAVLSRHLEKQLPVSNRDAIGAKLRVFAGDLVQVKEVRSAYSYCSANDLRAHFGLGQHARIDSVEIVWPSGERDLIEGVTANRLLVVHERGKAFETDWETGDDRVLRSPPRD